MPIDVDLSEFKEVSVDAFYASVGQLNVHPRPVGPWPYESHFKTPSGRVMGVVVPKERDTVAYYSLKGERYRYYVRSSLLS